MWRRRQKRCHPIAEKVSTIPRCFTQYTKHEVLRTPYGFLLLRLRLSYVPSGSFHPEGESDTTSVSRAGACARRVQPPQPSAFCRRSTCEDRCAQKERADDLAAQSHRGLHEGHRKLDPSPSPNSKPSNAGTSGPARSTRRTTGPRATQSADVPTGWSKNSAGSSISTIRQEHDGAAALRRGVGK